MRIELTDVAKGRKQRALPPISLTYETGTASLACAETEQRPTVLGLIASGRMRPDSGSVSIDGRTDAGALRRSIALVDALDVSEPEPNIPVAGVIAEELMFAGVRSDPFSVRQWIAEHGLSALASTPIGNIAPEHRIRLLCELAVLRPGVTGLVLTSPDRHGGEPDAWWAIAQSFAARGLAVLVIAGRASHSVIEAGAEGGVGAEAEGGVGAAGAGLEGGAVGAEAEGGAAHAETSPEPEAPASTSSSPAFGSPEPEAPASASSEPASPASEFRRIALNSENPDVILRNSDDSPKFGDDHSPGGGSTPARDDTSSDPRSLRDPDAPGSATVSARTSSTSSTADTPPTPGNDEPTDAEPSVPQNPAPLDADAEQAPAPLDADAKQAPAPPNTDAEQNPALPDTDAEEGRP